MNHNLTERPATPSSALRSRVSTGYARLDEALQGGFLAGSAIVLSAPASDEVPVLLRRFLEADAASLLISRSLSSAEPILGNKPDGLKCLVCSDKTVPPAQNTLPGKGIENLTELSLTITETINSLHPSRLVVQFLSDVLLRHKALQTRKWLSELLDKFRAKNITALVVLNPYMHSSEEVQAIVDLFNGNIELIEKQVEGQVRKALIIKWMHGIETAEKEFPLEGLAPEPQIRTEQVTVTPPPLKEPRWLTPLISRTTEMDKLKTAFEDALHSKSSVVALQGEAGIGKSRLMQELAAFANSKNAVALSGRASQDGPPYGPWIEIARQYVAQAPGELLRRMLGANASQVVKLVPDIAVKLGTVPPPRTGGQQDKTQFYEAVTQFFIAICREAPLLLLFDDMEYVDQPSAELWEYLVRSTSNLQILTVCSTPPEGEIESKSQLEQVLMKFNKERLLETVPVRGLGRDETTTLVRQTFGEETISHEFADLIYQHTGGNPFFVEEVLRSLVADGTIFRTAKGWDRKPIQDITIPKTVKTALRTRLEKLDPEAISMLQWAALIGSKFDFEVLKEASEISEEVLLQKLETTNNQGLILEIPNEHGRLGFVDERIRDLIIEDTMQLKQRRYHLKIAEALEKVYAQHLDSNSEMIATHFELCGDKERTIKYSIMAGDYAQSIHAYGQAADSYKRALDKVDVNETKQRASLLEKLGDCFMSAGQFANSVQRYQEALNLLEKSHDNTGCARISAQLTGGLHAVRGPEETVRFLKDAMKYVQENPESTEAASLYVRLSDYLGVLDRYDDANSWNERALEAGEKSGNYAAVSEALAYTAYILLDAGRIDEGLPKLEKSLQVAKQHDMYFQTGIAYLNLAGYTYPRDLSAARDLASQLLVLAKQENRLSHQATALAYLAVFDWLQGNWAEASEEFGEAFEIKNRLGFKFTGINAEAQRAEFFLSVGELERTEEYCRLALERHDEQISHIVATNLAVGKLRVEQGRVEEAKAHFEACVNAFKGHEFTTEPLWHIEALLHLTGIYVKLGQPEKARMNADWAKRLAETLKSNAGLAMARQTEANLLQASGELKAAQEAYQESLSLWEKAGWPYYQAKALVEYAEAIAKESAEESRKRLGEAVEIFKKLGAKRDVEMGEAKLSAK